MLHILKLMSKHSFKLIKYCLHFCPINIIYNFKNHNTNVKKINKSQ